MSLIRSNEVIMLLQWRTDKWSPVTIQQVVRNMTNDVFTKRARHHTTPPYLAQGTTTTALLLDQLSYELTPDIVRLLINFLRSLLLLGSDLIQWFCQIINTKCTLEEMIHFYEKFEEFKTMHSLAGGVWSSPDGSSEVRSSIIRTNVGQESSSCCASSYPLDLQQGEEIGFLDSWTSFPNKWIIWTS